MKKISFLMALLCASVMVFAETATMKYSGTTTANMEVAPANNAETVGLDATLFTVLADKGGNSNAPGLNKAGDIRLYANKADGNGNTITVSLNGGTINTITIDFKLAGTSEVKANGSVVTPADNVYTIGADAFTIQNTITGATTQVQINSIVIDYTVSGSAAIDWSKYEWLGNGSGDDKYTNKVKVATPEGVNAVNLQKPGFAQEAGIYVTFPAAPITACSLGDGKWAADGAGAVLYLTAFTAKETEVTLTANGVDYKVVVYFEDGGNGEQPGNQKDETGNLVEAGVAGYNGEGSLPEYAIDGNLGTRWGSNGGTHPDQDWFYVDLGKTYNVKTVKLLFENAKPLTFEILVSNDAATWKKVLDVTDEPKAVGAAATEADFNTYTLTDAIGRYVKIQALTMSFNGAYGISIWEFEVYGTPAEVSDKEAPVMGTATLVEATETTAVIAVAGATDNEGVTAYHVVDAANGVDQILVAEDGKLTVTGLEGSKTYNFVITAKDAAGNESANNATVEVKTAEDTQNPKAACPAPTWPAAQVKAIYSPTYNADCNFGEWGSNTQYTQTEFGKKYVLASGGYFGMVDFSLNCANMEKLHYDIWIAQDATIRIVPIWGGAEQGVTVNLKGQEWNAIDIALTEYTGVTDWTNIYQVKIDNASNLTLFIANAYFYRTAAIDDTEAPTAFTAVAGDALFFSANINAKATDNMGVVIYTVYNGEEVVATASGVSDVEKVITVSNLVPNTSYKYSVVAADEAGNKTEAIEVELKTLATPAAAPAPTTAEADVYSIYSDAYNTTATIAIGAWSQTTTVVEGALAEGDNAYFLDNTNYLGWEINNNSGIDVSEMNYLHMDIYSVNATAINVTPISSGAEGVYNLTLNVGEWNQIDVPLNHFTNVNYSAIIQIKWMDAVPSGSARLFIDNVYFSKEVYNVGVENVETKTSNVRKVIENGQVIILKDGQKYTVLGQIIAE